MENAPARGHAFPGAGGIHLRPRLLGFATAAHGDLAFALTLQYDMYLRRSEMLGLTLDHVGYPASGRYNKRSLVTDRRWLSNAMALYVGKCKHELFPNITLRFYERWCERRCKQLGYRSACIMPHILRHYGASNDMVHKRRSLHEIQRRGRWQARKVSPAMRSMLCCSNGGSKLRRNEWPRFDDNLRALAQPFCAF
eukprot:s5413_g7.t1